MRAHLALITLIAVATTLSAQQPPQTNTSTLDANGTAHITRVVPVPTTISSEAQASLRRPAGAENRTLAERRTSTDAWQTRAGETSRKAYPVKIESLTIANVPVRNVLPLQDTHPDHVLINVHGGGFNSDSGSFTESIPIANLTHTRVVAVLYRLAPEHPFPAAVDDTIAVYRDLLKTYKPAHIALYGTSAGAILTAEVAVRLKQLNLPLPAALGIFSGMGDFSQNGDSLSLYALRGLTGSISVAGTEPRSTEYTGTTDPKDPVLSPLYADLHGMPPTLFITSGRDILLSGTGILHRAFLRSGDDARLIVFEALPHAFWNDISLPETKEAYGYMADFFSQQLNR
ncbi:alpha/beta hydrolase fold domain-containing protein [Tunturiibacter empetritectus]|uniref:Acetyl esterase/lipase n=1 Tax=Tunturiibacter lichenicola TaxID=2051959 RepID=A0A852VA17_9BACT|nr:alpha/beta hydrolase fold domain-containing protein [Edaphobacter lichenicola]NYF89788.1 acetyl esterase/lipase [Edaphobacter lichenicola]